MRYAIRRLLHQPGFSLVVILTLALGIGANTAIFSLVNAVLLRSLPYDHPERLVTLNHYYPDLNNSGGLRGAKLQGDHRAHARLRSFAVAGRWNVNLTGTGEPEKLTGCVCDGGVLQGLRRRPDAGPHVPADGDCREGFKNVVVLGYGLWERRFGSDRNIVGKKVVLGGEPFEVIGVMPRGLLRALQPARRGLGAGRVQAGAVRRRRADERIPVSVGRLRPGIPVDQATREVTAFAEGLKHDHPSSVRPHLDDQDADASMTT